jgi:LysM repeat protein
MASAGRGGALPPGATPRDDVASRRPDEAPGSIFQSPPTPMPSFRQGPPGAGLPDGMLPPVEQRDGYTTGYPADIAVERDRRRRGRGLLTLILALGFIAIAGAGGYGAAVLISRTAAAPTPSTTLRPSPSAAASVSPGPSGIVGPSGSAPASTSPVPSGSAGPSSSVRPSGSPGATPVVHTVKPGETLGSIAKKYGVTVAAIQAVNDIPDPNKIRVGQKITIPPKP